MRVFRFLREAEWIEAGRECLRRAATARGPGPLRICLAGGRTPEPLYRGLAALALDGVEIELWLGDERQADPDSPDRNGNLILRAFSSCAWNPKPRFRAWPDGTAATAARAYEALLEAVEAPVFDLSLLGIGADGHTAGLFPGDPALREASRLAVPSTAPAEPRRRMTLTPSALASTRTLRYLLRGPEKRALAERIEAGSPPGRDAYPAEVVAALAEARGAEVAILYCEE